MSCFAGPKKLSIEERMMQSVAAAQSSSKVELSSNAGERHESSECPVASQPHGRASSISGNFNRACSCSAGGTADIEDDDEDFDALD